ncbi:sulfite exporter TauE/SafE family protein [Antarcticimicrobium sediminis]|uniref:Probable membrane transporter protein n=1 Tax=Antarcticimicrobium sediminis TaxID=2546227 RepID=A0A4R5F1D9_9RHOB|nr:sulfite exporter TauE/SafE family protein [Antarcticimicrobium sediminis]TDE41241.1 sulfite exporter TauE/SafE family protein [Antarcticimicrobium sediminis]
MPDTTLLLQMLVMLMVIGGFAGVLAGLLGVGGGIVLVPSFFYAFQTLGYGGPQLMQMCLATSLATIIVTSVRSVLSHNKKGAVVWPILRSWGPGIAMGAVLGVLVVASLRSSVLQGLFGVIGIVIGLYLGFGKSEWRLGEEMPKGIRRAIVSPIVGFLSVLMGIGGGSFGVPLMSLYNIPIHRAVATAAGFGVIIAVPSVAGFMLLSIDPANRPPFSVGAVNLPAFLVVIAMTLTTAPWGVKLAHAMDPKPLKRIFAVFLTLVALNMLRKALGW